MKRRLGTAVNTPIVLVVGFNLFTLAVFVTAPIRWGTDNVSAVCVLVLVCQAVIVGGFIAGRKNGASSYTRVRLPLGSGRFLMRCSIVVYPFTALIGYAYRMGYAPWDIRGMYTLLLMGLSNRSFGYEMALRGTGLGPLPWRIYFLASIVNQCFFIAGFLRWRRMGLVARSLFVVFVAVELFFAVGRGTSFGVVSMVTTFFMSSMLWMKSNRSRTVAVLGGALLVAFLFGGSIAFFSYNLYSRSNNLERELETYEFQNSSTIFDSPVLTSMPPALRPTYMNVVAYLSGGYYHASLTFDLEFQSTFMVGNNPSLIGLALLFGNDVWNRTYMHRLQVARGVDELGVWHSAYTWYANDVSYYGVPLVVFGLAYFFGFSWSRARRGDFLSGIVFIIFGNMLLFLFANNTYLSSVFYSFMFLLPFWIITRVLPFLPAAAILGRRRARAAALAHRLRPHEEALR
jgi:hypothetical protein